MELFLVLLLFGMVLRATAYVILNAVDLFSNREKYRTKAKITNIEYKEKPGTTVYFVEFLDKDSNRIQAKSLQYKGQKKFEIGQEVDIDYLIRDEMKDLIGTELVDVLHPDHISMTDAFKNGPYKIMNFMSIGFIVAGLIAMVYYFVK